MTRTLRASVRGFACISALVLGAWGCSGDKDNLGVDPIVPDAATLYWKLEAEHPAIVLSTHAPYDTVQLRAVPRNVYGEALPFDGVVNYRKLINFDTAVTVDTSGFVTAKYPAPASRIEVTLTVDGVTHGDTITIMVSDESPVQRIDSLVFDPTVAGDSARRWSGRTSDDIRNAFPAWVQAFAGSDEVPGQQFVVDFSYDSARIIDCFSGEPCGAGQTYIRARTYAYGRDVVDSVLFQRIEPTAKAVVIRQLFPVAGGKTITFLPQVLRIRAGMTVFFFNVGRWEFSTEDELEFSNVSHATTNGAQTLLWVDSVDVVFDDPSAAEPGDSYGVMFHAPVFNSTSFLDLFSLGYPGGDGGNIPAFGNVWDKQDRFFSTLDPGWRSRKFTRPGTYRYTSTRFPGVSGTIVVTE